MSDTYSSDSSDGEFDAIAALVAKSTIGLAEAAADVKKLKAASEVEFAQKKINDEKAKLGNLKAAGKKVFVKEESK